MGRFSSSLTFYPINCLPDKLTKNDGVKRPRQGIIYSINNVLHRIRSISLNQRFC